MHARLERVLRARVRIMQPAYGGTPAAAHRTILQDCATEINSAVPRFWDSKQLLLVSRHEINVFD